MKLLLFIALVLSTLTGCVPVVLVAGGALAGSTLVGDSRNLQTINTDKDATFQANTRLSADKTLPRGTRVSATVFNHEMLLVGQVLTEENKMQVEDRVKSVPNVNKIYNQITVGESLGALSASSDTALTGNIKTQMMATKNVKSGQFKIVTEDGVVYILGLTTRDQADMTVNLIREIAGVKRVVTLIRYLN
jgi:osmotically-inducible protein OsmY